MSETRYAVQTTTGSQANICLSSGLDVVQAIVDGTNAADAGNTPTTTLRPGLIMKLSSGKAVAYGASGTPFGILLDEVNTLDANGDAADCVANFAIGGVFDYDKITAINSSATLATVNNTLTNIMFQDLNLA